MTREELRAASEKAAAELAAVKAADDQRREETRLQRAEHAWRACMADALSTIAHLVTAAVKRGTKRTAPYPQNPSQTSLRNNLRWQADVHVTPAEMTAKVVAWAKFKYPDLDVVADKVGDIYLSWE